MSILRQFIISSIWSIFAALVLAITPVYAQTKRALIVAIGDYPNTTDWPDLNSSNDVPLIEKALRKQNFTDFIVLRDEKAVKKNILAALDTLINHSQKGDIVVIHFSSHGQQINDNDNDELDAYDEAIVCYGAPSDTSGKFANYDGSQHLRDDELGEFISRLRKQLGADGDVLLIADACHSGTITRGNGGRLLTRGNKKAIHLAGYKSRTDKKVAKQTQPFLSSTTNREVNQKGLASYVLISAARADESNEECITETNIPAGSLSYAFSRSMNNLREGETYRLLFNRIVTEFQRMGKSQHPEIEGTMDRQLFGGKMVIQSPYYNVVDIVENRRQLTIPGGKLEMIYSGTKVLVCPARTINPTNSVKAISGTVTGSTLFSATINLVKPLPSGMETEFWVFLQERSFGDLTIRVNLDSIQQPALRQQLQGSLATLKLVKFERVKPELRICQRDSAGLSRVVVQRVSDGTAFGDPIWIKGPADAETLSTRVQNYVQAKFLQNFNPSHPDINIRIEVLPNKLESQNAYDTTSREAFIQNGILAVPPGWVSIRVINTGTLPVYYSIIDIQPDGIVSVIFPRPISNGYPTESKNNSNKPCPDSNDTPGEYQIQPGKSIIIPCRVKISPPYGNETFKVLASQDLFDLRKVINMREQGDLVRRGFSNDLEMVFGKSQILARGEPNVTSFPETTISSFNYTFQIIPKKP